MLELQLYSQLLLAYNLFLSHTLSEARDSPFFLSANGGAWAHDGVFMSPVSFGTMSFWITSSAFPLGAFFWDEASCLITPFITRPEGTLSNSWSFPRKVQCFQNTTTPMKICKQRKNKSLNMALGEGNHRKFALRIQ